MIDFEETARILKNNLRLICSDSEALLEEKQILIKEHIGAIIADATSPEAAIEQALALYRNVSDDGTARNYGEIDEKLLISKMLLDKFPLSLLAREYNIAPFPSDANIAYLNATGLTASVCQKLHQHFPDWKYLHTESYTEICEMVSDSVCEFGVLPIENSADGRLNGFYRMIDRFDLKICAVCDIEDETKDIITRFAVVADRHYQIADGDPVYIEISLTANPLGISDMVSVARYLALPIVRLSSMPLYYSENAHIDNITIALSKDALAKFLLFLHLFHKEATILGFYFQM